MSFPRYPKYKDSGVEWLGDVPEHWSIVPFKYLVTLCGGGTPSKINLDYWDGNVPWASAKDLKSDSLSDTEDHITQFAVDNGAAELVAANSLLIVVRGMILVHTFPVVKALVPMAINQDLKAIRPASRLDVDFLAWQLRGSTQETIRRIDEAGHGTKVLRMEAWTSMPMPIPALAEQTAIAAFLDRETAKIDALVAEQRRLIELLKEKRQAVISHAVTKGLNPHASMKPSGIEWLGEVPEHWDVRKVSHFFRAGKGKNGQMLTKEFCAANEGDYPVYSGQTENDGVMATWNEFEFDFGETGVLFSTTVGAKAMHLRQLFGKFSLSQNCMVIWPTSSICITRFFYYHFQPLFQYERALIPEHMQASFRFEDLYGYQVALPPSCEQAEIVAFLDEQTSRFDSLTMEAERAIDLLQERRTALISAAVTGKIDVRGLAQTEAA